MRDSSIGIPHGSKWPERSLADVTEVLRRGVAPAYVDSSTVRVIGQRCVQWGGFRAEAARPHDSALLNRSLIVKPGDVLLNSTGAGTIGRSCIFDTDDVFAVDSHVTLLRAKRELIEPRWLDLVLRSPWGQIYLESHCFIGSTNQVELSGRQLARTTIPVPPLREQQRVVGAVDAVAAQERVAEALIAKLDMIEAGLMAELSVVECDSFEQALDFGPQNGIYKPSSSYGLEGTPIVRINSFDGGPSDFTCNLARVSLTKAELDRYQLSVGDVIINRVNSLELVGKSTTVGALMESTVFESNMMRCKVAADRALTAFVEVWLSSQTVKRYFRARAKSAISQASINGSDIRACPFPKLEIVDQRKFLRRLSAVRDQRMSESSELAKLGDIKRGVINELLAFASS